MRNPLKYAATFAAGYVAAHVMKHVSVGVSVPDRLYMPTGYVDGPLHERVAQGARNRLYLSEDVTDEDMFPYVCSGCGRNYDWEGGAPDECPHCGCDLIRTE